LSSQSVEQLAPAGGGLAGRLRDALHGRSPLASLHSCDHRSALGQPTLIQLRMTADGQRFSLPPRQAGLGTSPRRTRFRTVFGAT